MKISGKLWILYGLITINLYLVRVFPKIFDTAKSALQFAFPCDLKMCGKVVVGRIRQLIILVLLIKLGSFSAYAQGAADALPIRVFLDDQLITETNNPAAAVASEVLEPKLSTEVMDLHLSVNGSQIKRFMSVAVFKDDGAPANSGSRKPIEFRADWNYEKFVSKGEIRIYEAGQQGKGVPVKILRLNKNRTAIWKRPIADATTYAFALRLYGTSGGFDQSQAVVIEEELRGYSDSNDWRERKIGEFDFADVGIELYGAQLAVELTDVPAGHRVIVNNHEVFASQGRANLEFVLPPGEHMIRVKVQDQNGEGLTFERKAFVPQNNYFFAGLGDLTVGARTGRDFSSYLDTEQSTQEIDLFDSVGIEGQASMFLKGRILGKYLITAALDTGERSPEEFKDLLQEIVARDPNAVITQIDPDQTYSVYGDQSSLSEDAPTERLFVKIQRGESHLLWGSFSISIRGNSFATIERSVYGAELKHTKQIQTDIGTAYLDTTAFALPPGQLQQHEKIPGNGGFIYRLEQSNIIKGTEIVRITVEDPLSGAIIEEQDLFRGLDFDIDYLQGQIVLTSPLPEFEDEGSAVSENGVFGDNRVFLIVIYEYQPLEASANSLVMGGRTALTLGEFVSVGVTALVDGSGPVNQTMYGADAQANFGQQSFVKAQIAKTDTLGSGEILSSSGFSGLGTNPQTTSANGYKAEFNASLNDLGVKDLNGSISGFYHHKDLGFAAPGQSAFADEDVYNANLNVPLLQGRLRLTSSVNGRQDNTNMSNNREMSADLDYDFNDRLTAGVGLKHLNSETFFGGAQDRTDAGATLTYRMNEKLEVGAFAQTSLAANPSTLKRTRFGLRGDYKFTDRISANAEVSAGTGLVEGRVELAHTSDFGERTYVSYESAATPEGFFNLAPQGENRSGLLKLGTRKSLDGGVSVSAESRVSHGSNLDILQITQSAGVEFSPDDKWQASLDGELSGFWGYQFFVNRGSLRGSIGYTGDSVDSSGSVEFRREGSRDTLETSGSVSMDYDPNWKLYAKLNTVSRSNDGISDSNFFKADVGAAYRPVNNNKFSSVFNYKAYYDLPSNDDDQDAFSAAEYKQRSHIFSFDGSYAFTPRLTIGGKYGIKWGQVTSSRQDNDWDSSTVHLLVGRADVNFAKSWDAVLEGRLMNLSEGNSTRTGALAAIYRHFGKNLKAGVGYNFSSVSDDLTNVNASSVGYFFNVISKF